MDIFDTADTRPTGGGAAASGAGAGAGAGAHISPDVAALREEVRKKLGGWYMQRHGVDAAGNVQVTPFPFIPFRSLPFLPPPHYAFTRSPLPPLSLWCMGACLCPHILTVCSH